jgi:hypothetical protein
LNGWIKVGFLLADVGFFVEFLWKTSFYAFFGKKYCFRAPKIPNSGMGNPNLRTDFLFYVDLYVDRRSKKWGNVFLLLKGSISGIYWLAKIDLLWNLKYRVGQCKPGIYWLNKIDLLWNLKYGEASVNLEFID